MINIRKTQNKLESRNIFWIHLLFLVRSFLFSLVFLKLCFIYQTTVRWLFFLSVPNYSNSNYSDYYLL